ncbi:MAG: alpha-D-ribose 1-methylphosphonate 5-triphosphate diphosphatase [Moorella sp. (in: firmicutes)]|nr:alpha-D-ribose 1-methylphosphonate 5-triphosphate diphosphatase [Moorella sp. (in: firmicutes)]MDK2895197.1 alpha-D-ribose 1-methylphosphonate 5-triphosphate diphosphatase [Moorella sp. (in: firmicutes)]
MNADLVIVNGRAVTPNGVLEKACLAVSRGIIVDIRPAGQVRRPLDGRAGEEVLDARGAWILPGCVDLHSDALEREIEPRPRALFPVELAFRELEKRLAGCGITTIFHAISFAKEELGLRSNELSARVIRHISELAAGPALIRHRIHLRYEITDLSAVPLIMELLGEGKVDLLSFMDHTPGQGQFRELEKYKEWIRWSYGVEEKDVAKLLTKKKVNRDLVLAAMRQLASKAREAGIPVASHDDDSLARITMSQELGISISEFPVNLETASLARKRGLHVCVGAPNAVRGASQAGNLSAREAVEAGAANILCSDYYPSAMLWAALRLAPTPDALPQSVALVSANPARAVGLDGEVGALEVGRRADLVLVNLEEGIPKVLMTMVDGEVVYSLNYRYPEEQATACHCQSL